MPDAPVDGAQGNTQRAPRGYEAVKALAKACKQPLDTLVAMCKSNDPFFCGSATDYARGQWFADLWQALGAETGVHLRRLHYKLVASAKYAAYSGEPYANTDHDWQELLRASLRARILGLVPADAFVDERTAPPQLPSGFGEPHAAPSWHWDDEHTSWELPTIDADVQPYWHWPRPVTTGYEYAPSDQPYHLELWVEKSTLDDVLLPVCRRYGAVLVTGKGFQSLCNILVLVHRMRQLRKPTRIWYMSDFDPSGEGMPVTVARWLEWWLPTYLPDADVRLTQLALTHTQTVEYQLPRTAIKETDKGKAGHEQRYGEGATEIDAVEAIHPGVLAGLVRAAMAPYYDAALGQASTRTAAAADTQVQTAWADAAADITEDYTALRDAVRAICEPYQVQLTDLQARLEADLQPLAAPLETLALATASAQEAFDPALPDRPEPHRCEETATWLFDTRRDYPSQLAAYKRQNGTRIQKGARHA